MQTSRQDLSEVFGQPIHTYTRAQAIEDGVLVDVTSAAKQAGFRIPVAMTRGAWAECVEWSDEDSKRDSYENEAWRLWTVMWVAYTAARRGGAQASFELYRVPRGGCGVKPPLVMLSVVCGPGDSGEPVITILQLGEG